MKEASSPQSKSHGGTHRSSRRPDSNPVPVNGHSPGLESAKSTNGKIPTTSLDGKPGGIGLGLTSAQSAPTSGAHSRSGGSAVNTPPVAQPGSVVGTDAEKQDQEQKNKEKKPIMQRFWLTTKAVLLSSKINVLLVFVPVGIVVAQFHSLSPAIIFAMNAVAIVPLAGLLSFATESVAHRLGDSLGALLNVTFGNAVELIIFIALVKNEIRIVQASLLGSILANLLLILGMSFFLGGLRFREQIYNSTVTQMSACLLSLSVISLVLPTAFHASFRNNELADKESLKVSRGTSVILLLVYILYLLFQLISHSYLYESTPQHIIDEEATPGPAANWLDSSNSDSSSSSDSDSSDSDHSRNTMSKRMRRVMHRRRRSSAVSSETGELSHTSPTTAPAEDPNSEEPPSRPRALHKKSSSGGSVETEDRKSHGKRRRRRLTGRKHRKHKHRHMTESPEAVAEENNEAEPAGPEARRVEFAPDTAEQRSTPGEPQTRSPFQGLRSMSFRPVVSSLAPSVFTQPTDASTPSIPPGPVPRVRYGIRRTNSLPDRLNQYYRPPGAMMPSQIPLAHRPMVSLAEEDGHAGQLSRTAAVILLLASTALVAVCAEFMVDSINGLVKTSGVNEVFIGLIILPIVGNAAEHVTAITVAMKNKMDLSIGVAVGSSIQIALFITPLVVIIGWAMDREMSLYFTLFETVCLFVSAFITNFLVLDGRSNYLEGALLMSTYVIIAVAAFFYPKVSDASAWGA
ncbi:Sodium/calcium exchanger protein-domain-containing protein [Corynascus novoguineensis]|uniref:Sodium/calcium exchanger protein-domain-containing protein n=1 Tax=Corynascus novoguineensis TaxID=1126955 RepID=A0AAN7HIS8_9PEZI|nr:Sodium/calcium exchanger protein-domain-containing protein [Corynascus novoguineensis]